ncbi:MAG TPA: acyltransferase family protein [Rhodanobacter sp.]
MTGSKPAYFPYIDGLRAIAVAAVIAYHLKASWLPGGFAGVDVFFVISGFIVSASVGSLERMELIKFIPFFYARRLLRIGPALVVCLLLVSLVSALIIPSAWLSRTNQQTGIYAFFGLSNFVLARTNNDYFSPTTDFNPFTHTWSLGVEEQFYFIFPVLFFAWTLRGRQRRLNMVLPAAAVAVSLVFSSWLGQTDKVAAYYMIGSRFWQLGAGVLLYQSMTLAGQRFDVADQPSPNWFIWGAAASLVAFGYGLLVSDPSGFPFPGSLWVVLGTLGLLGFLHGKSRAVPLVKVLEFGPVRFVGRISYSLYLWHWPVFVFFRWTVGLDAPLFQFIAMLLVFIFSVASYRFVETPVRRLRVARHAPRLTVVAVALALIATASWATRRINAAQPRISLTTIARHAQDWYPEGANSDPAYPGCTVSLSIEKLGSGTVATYSRRNCNHVATAPRVLAIGDSHALAYTPMYKEYVLATGASVILYNNSGCSFMSLQPWREESAVCTGSTAATTADMLKRLAPGDVIFLPSLRLPRFADQWVRFPDSTVREDVFSAQAMKSRAQATEAAVEVLTEFHEKQTRVIIEGPTPIFKSPIYRCAQSYNRSNPICSGGTTISRVEMMALRKPVLDALTNLTTRVPNVHIWDPFPVLCPPGPTCDAFAKGRPLFFDGDHISGYANRVLLPSFTKSVRSPE